MLHTEIKPSSKTCVTTSAAMMDPVFEKKSDLNPILKDRKQLSAQASNANLTRVTALVNS